MEEELGPIQKAVARAETLSKSAIEAAEATMKAAQEVIGEYVRRRGKRLS